MSSILDKATDQLSENVEQRSQHEFYHFEPWDIEARPKWLIDLAAEYDVELEVEGNDYQIGRLMERSKHICCTIASNQTGKSLLDLIQAIIMLTGELPYSMCYDKGVDTGVARLVTAENLSRFGNDGKGGCGNIIGVGKYPMEKIAKGRGNAVWICCWKKNRDEFWVPRLTKLIPDELLDKTRGVDGYGSAKNEFYLHGDNRIVFITYEQGYKRVEAAKVWMILLDEEPPDRRFYISTIEHCIWMNICFTPINGMTWSYRDIYLPVKSGANQNVALFVACQYDSPYQIREMINEKIRQYKPWEIKARVFGVYSDMEGKPYYDFDLTQKFLRDYNASYFLETVYPDAAAETIAQVIQGQVAVMPAVELGPDTWEMYEKIYEKHTYWISCDTARGDPNPELAQDMSCAYLFRLPHEENKNDPDEPILVGTLYSTERNFEFGRLVVYMAVRCNMCLIAPESKGEDGASLLTEIRDYPFIYRMTVIHQRLRKTIDHVGFDTSPRTRKPVFDYVGQWIKGHAENSKIYHHPLLFELAGVIVGKKGRPDHGQHGSTDCVIAFGIGLYVYHQSRNQIRHNGDYYIEQDKRTPVWERYADQVAKETRPIRGAKMGLDQREALGLRNHAGMRNGTHR